MTLSLSTFQELSNGTQCLLKKNVQDLKKNVTLIGVFAILLHELANSSELRTTMCRPGSPKIWSSLANRSTNFHWKSTVCQNCWEPWESDLKEGSLRTLNKGFDLQRKYQDFIPELKSKCYSFDNISPMCQPNLNFIVAKWPPGPQLSIAGSARPLVYSKSLSLIAITILRFFEKNEGNKVFWDYLL